METRWERCIQRTTLEQARFYHMHHLRKIQPHCTLPLVDNVSFWTEATRSRRMVFPPRGENPLVWEWWGPKNLPPRVEIHHTCSSEQQTYFRYSGHALHWFQSKNVFSIFTVTYTSVPYRVSQILLINNSVERKEQEREILEAMWRRGFVYEGILKSL